jgi:hypothetical protein
MVTVADRGRMNEELKLLYEEDRRDAQTFPGDESFIASQGRRSRVEIMLKRGQVRTAEDYFHAAAIFHHGERLEHWAQAHLLARTAAEMGYRPGRYQAAAAYDRWLMRQGLPQKYGTNSVEDGDYWRIWDVDPHTTDSERAQWDVPPMDGLVNRAYNAFGNLRRSQVFCNPLVKLELDGLKIGLFEVGRPPSETDGLLLGTPDYEKFNRHEARPGYLPDNVTLWRCGRLFCAKDARSRVVVTWHPCRWAVIQPEDADPLAVYGALAGRPQRITPEGAFWMRLALAVGPDRGWIVGGTLEPSTLAYIALSLG